MHMTHHPEGSTPGSAYECPRGTSDCGCTPLHPGDRITFHCVTHDENVEATVMFFEAGHTYTVKADCGIASVSTTQVTPLAQV